MLGNSDAASGDWVPVRGSDLREAVSARLDGEDAGLPPADIDAHWPPVATAALGSAARRAPTDHPALDPALLAALAAPPDRARPGLLARAFTIFRSRRTPTCTGRE